MSTRSDSQIPSNKVYIDYLGTQECGGELGKVLFGDGVGALRESSARRRWTPRNNAMRKNNVGMATRRFLLEIFILNSIQNYTKIINTVLISYRSNNAVSMLFTTWHGWFIFGSNILSYHILTYIAILYYLLHNISQTLPAVAFQSLQQRTPAPPFVPVAHGEASTPPVTFVSDSHSNFVAASNMREGSVLQPLARHTL